MDDTVCVLECPPPDTINCGATGVVIAGWAARPSAKLKGVVLSIGKELYTARLQPSLEAWRWLSHETPLPSLPICGFQVIARIHFETPAIDLPVRLGLSWSDGQEELRQLGNISVLPAPSPDILHEPHPGEGPFVAICMAVYSPNIALFKEQIDSIRRQTYRNWICLIQDDASPEPFWTAIQEIVQDDSRFILNRNEKNLGFYLNFERALYRVPANVVLVALADQDDRWYPEKIARCVTRVNGKTALAYCESRVIDSKGKILRDRLSGPWAGAAFDRAALMMRNAVTGAASVFRRDILDRALPFPPKGNHSFFHDHWIACCAATAGAIDHLDVPLYDYVQHGENIVGASSALPQKLYVLALAQFVLPPLYFLGLRINRVAQIAQRRSEALVSYALTESRRIGVFAATLQLRFPETQGRWRRIIDELAEGWEGIGARAWFRSIWRLNVTEGAEVKIIAGRMLATFLARTSWMSVPRQRP